MNQPIKIWCVYIIESQRVDGIKPLLVCYDEYDVWAGVGHGSACRVVSVLQDHSDADRFRDLDGVSCEFKFPAFRVNAKDVHIIRSLASC